MAAEGAAARSRAGEPSEEAGAGQQEAAAQDPGNEIQQILLEVKNRGRTRQDQKSQVIPSEEFKYGCHYDSSRPFAIMPKSDFAKDKGFSPQNLIRLKHPLLPDSC